MVLPVFDSVEMLRRVGHETCVTQPACGVRHAHQLVFLGRTPDVWHTRVARGDEGDNFQMCEVLRTHRARAGREERDITTEPASYTTDTYSTGER